ncbi:MAG: sugar ABC transporter permease, partial [Alphaproteobacteria bacterium HGW-Alphaproteobacteria-10]
MTVAGVRVGVNGGLALLLLALGVTFSLLVGERFYAASTLRSMAFQLPELGILSLAMMITLLKGGLNLSIVATANLSGLTMAWCLTTLVPGSEGLMWGFWQIVSLLAG